MAVTNAHGAVHGRGDAGALGWNSHSLCRTIERMVNDNYSFPLESSNCRYVEASHAEPRASDEARDGLSALDAPIVWRN